MSLIINSNGKPKFINSLEKMFLDASLKGLKDIIKLYDDIRKLEQIPKATLDVVNENR